MSQSNANHQQANHQKANDQQTGQANEYHIASFVAQAPPQLVEALSHFVNSYQGCEVHGHSEQGKIVFTVEATSQKAIAKIVDQIRLTDEFLSISPVYHQFLTEPQAPVTTEVN
ncbi:chaperone NapD [Thalassotalea montiporae]